MILIWLIGALFTYAAIVIRGSRKEPNVLLDLIMIIPVFLLWPFLLGVILFERIDI